MKGKRKESNKVRKKEREKERKTEIMLQGKIMNGLKRETK